MTIYPTPVDSSAGTWQIDISRKADGHAIVQCVLAWSLTNRETSDQEPLPQKLVRALGRILA